MNQKGPVKKLEPGDIILTTGLWGPDRPKPKTFKDRLKHIGEDVTLGFFGPKANGSYEHAAMYVGNNEVVEAFAQGVIKRPFEKSTRKRGYVVLRPEVPKAKRREAAEFARSKVGKSYDIAGMLAAGSSLFLPKDLGRRILTGVLSAPNDPNKQQAFECAALVSAAYLNVGAQVSKDAIHWRFAAPSHLWANPKNKEIFRSDKGKKIYAPASYTTVYKDIAPRLTKEAWASFEQEVRRIRS